LAIPKRNLILAGLGGAAGLIVIAVCGLLFYLKTPTGAAQLLELINAKLPGEIQAQTVTFDPLKLEATLLNAHLTGPDGAVIVSSPKVIVGVKLLPLAYKHIVLTRIDIARPIANLRLGAENRLNIVDAFARPHKPPTGLKVEIQELTASQARVGFSTANRNLHVELTDADLLLSGLFGGGFLLAIDLPKAQMTLNQGQRHFTFGRTAAACRLSSERGLERLAFESAQGESILELNGQLTKPAQTLAAELKFKIKPGDLYQGFKPPLPGVFSGRLTAAGSLAKPEFELALKHSGGRYKTFEFGPSELQAAIKDRNLKLERLKVAYAAGLITLKGQADLSNIWPTGNKRFDPNLIGYQLSFKANGINIGKLPQAPAKLSGRFDSQGDLKGAGLKKLSFTAELKSPDLAYAKLLPPTRLEITAGGSFDGRTITLGKLKAMMPNARMQAAGSFQPASGSIKAQATASTNDLAGLLKPYAISARGSAELRAALGGTIKTPHAQLTASATKLGYKQFELGNATAQGKLDPNGWLAVERLSLQNNFSRLDAAGRIKIFNRNGSGGAAELNATALNLNPKDFLPTLALTAKLNGHLNAKLQGGRPQATADLAGKDLKYKNTSLGQLLLSASLDGRKLDLARCELVNGHSKLSASGSLNLGQQLKSAPEAGSLNAVAQLDLADLNPQASGLVNLNANLDGSLKNLSGQAAISGRELELAGQKIAAADASAAIDGQRVDLTKLIVTFASGGSLSGPAWIDFNGNYGVDLLSQGLRLEDLITEKTGLRGAVTAELHGRGQLANPALDGRLSLSELQYARTEGDSSDVTTTDLPDGSLAFRLANHHARLSGRFDFEAQADYDLKTKRYSLNALFDQTALAPYLSLLKMPQLSGEINGRLAASGQGRDLQSIKATADLSAFDIDQARRNLLSARDLKIIIDQGRIDVPPALINLAEQGSMSLSAAGSLPDRLNLKAEGDIPASVLTAFSDEFTEPSGRLKFKALSAVQGGHQKLDAEISFDGLSATLTANDQRLSDLSGRIAITNGLAHINGLSGKLDSGTFKADGTVALDGFKPRRLNLNARTKGLPLAIPETMDLTVDSNLTLTATPERARLEGLVTVTDGTYYKDVRANLFANVLDTIIRVQPRRSRQADANPWLERTTLDLDVDRRGTLRVENNLAELEINPDLKISGTLASPVVNGRVSVTNGTVTYQGIEFTVKQGNVDFLNPARTEARVDIISQTSVRDWTIQLALKGTLNELELTLSSEPSENQTDILSLLLVGRTTREMSSNKESISASPAGMLAEMLTSTYAKEIKATTSLDIFKLESDDFSPGGLGSLKFTLGKKISRRLTLKYELDTKDSAATQRGIAEYKLLDTLYFNGYQGNNGVYGADIQYRYEYR